MTLTRSSLADQLVSVTIARVCIGFKILGKWGKTERIFPGLESLEKIEFLVKVWKVWELHDNGQLIICRRGIQGKGGVGGGKPITG